MSLFLNFLGLSEDTLVECSLITDAALLRKVYLAPISTKDWEIIVRD